MSALSGGNWGIPGSLTFSGGGAGAMQGLGGSPYQAMGALGNDYASAYNSALTTNQNLYNNILAGYQQLMGQQVPAEAQISQGYTNLENQVLKEISGIGASAGQQIADLYNKQTGASQQQLINSGLGNSTVLQSVQRGNTLDYAKAQVALQNQVAGLSAGYMSNLGLAGLNYQNQALMQNTGLGLQQLNWENTVMAPYPNAGLYGQLAQGYGAMAAANAARGQMGGMRSGGSPLPFGPTGGYGGGLGSNYGVVPPMNFGEGASGYGQFPFSGYSQAAYNAYPTQSPFMGIGTAQGAGVGTGEGGPMEENFLGGGDFGAAGYSAGGGF